MTDQKQFFTQNRQWLSIIFVIGITLIALFVGRLVKDSLENKTFPYQRGGVSVQISKGWSVKNGIEGESMLFTASDPFDQSHSYYVAQQPIVPGGLLTDSVVTRNFDRAQELQSYQVLEQADVKLVGREAYRVKYVYITTPKFSKIPVVMMGVDYYWVDQSRIVIVGMEDQSTLFDGVYPAFIRFLNGLSITKGG